MLRYFCLDKQIIAAKHRCLVASMANESLACSRRSSEVAVIHTHMHTCTHSGTLSAHYTSAETYIFHKGHKFRCWRNSNTELEQHKCCLQQLGVVCVHLCLFNITSTYHSLLPSITHHPLTHHFTPLCPPPFFFPTLHISTPLSRFSLLPPASSVPPLSLALSIWRDITMEARVWSACLFVIAVLGRAEAQTQTNYTR